ncbi:hypothetical protein GOQ29_06945 [Clostridium sp. D2Q-14]|uniref:hypothetical protein n=1 Tax=Anaeromonas gelatinilytica TaxID=2683194 RepID=UPI00193B430D|nr:hypothetical protein [Anaeromonas gelatinilytica]MBS4535353.1 hypothetical protein [Anaeromonas gelatinilytica]
MIFKDYTETNIIYHIASIIDLKKILEEGIKYDDKVSYRTKYLEFHRFINKYKSLNVPSWVVRQKTIFGSMNFNNEHKWHSHTVILGIKINEDYCWVANENLVNEIYEPFILKDITQFDFMKDYIKKVGINNIKKYWNNSLSFKENLMKRLDKNKDYDCEVLVFHDIKPEDIIPIGIVTDHKYIEYKNLENIYLKEGK